MGTFKVDDGQYRWIDSRMMRIKKALGDGDLDPKKLEHHLDEALERRFVGDVLPLEPLIKFRMKNAGLMNDSSFAPLAQIANVRSWNMRYGWGFDDKDFRAMDKCIPMSREGSRLVLVPYLDTPLETLNALLRTLGDEYPLTVSINFDSEITNKRFRLFPDIAHKRGLRWESVMLDAKPEKRKPFRDPETMAHAGVLTAALQCPGWLLALVQRKALSVAIPVYQLTPSDSVVIYCGPEHRTEKADPWTHILAFGAHAYSLVIHDIAPMYVAIPADDRAHAIPRFAQ